MKVGHTNLTALLREIQPSLIEEYYVFCTLSPETFSQLTIRPRGVFYEVEGVTAILEVGQAKGLGLSTSPAFALITLTVHSDLLAVGFLAVIAQRLAGAGISMNVVSAFYHDHVFVPAADAKRTMDVLNALVSEARSNHV